MIDFYTATTFIGRRAAIALAECELQHNLHRLDRKRGEQRAAWYLELNPLGTIPMIVDHAGPQGATKITQSGAIILYCANKTNRLLPADSNRRNEAFEWFMLALTDVGPASAAIFHSSRIPDPSDANNEYFLQQFRHYCSIVDNRLSGRTYLADEFSIADVALYPVIETRLDIVKATPGLSNLKSWQERVADRPKTALAMQDNG